jgi:hypothetical protein
MGAKAENDEAYGNQQNELDNNSPAKLSHDSEPL